MPFAARNDDGWRLCLRKGGTFTHINDRVFPSIPIQFPNNASAKECADDLNLHWDDWDRAYLRKRRVPLDADTFMIMLMTVAKHGGITKQQYREICNAL